MELRRLVGRYGGGSREQPYKCPARRMVENGIYDPPPHRNWREQRRQLWVKYGRKRGPADRATSRPVNPQVRTRPGALANFRLCARERTRYRGRALRAGAGTWGEVEVHWE